MLRLIPDSRKNIKVDLTSISSLLTSTIFYLQKLIFMS